MMNATVAKKKNGILMFGINLITEIHVHSSSVLTKNK